MDRAGAVVKQPEERVTRTPLSGVSAEGAGSPRNANKSTVAGERSQTLTPAAGIDAVAPVAGDEGFSAVFESSGEALIVTDSTGVIHRANSQAERLLGVGESHARGVGLGTVLAEQSGAQLLLLYDSAGSARRGTVDARLATGHPIRITLRAVLPHSQALLLRLEQGAVDREPEVERPKIEAEFRSILESVNTGIVVFDSAGRVRFSNGRFGDLFAISVRNMQDMRTCECSDARWRSSG